MIVFEYLHSLAPSYLANDCVLASAAAGRRHLRSTDTMKLLVRWTRTVIGARDFAVSATAIWNSLPAALRLSSCSVQTFAQKLKTFYASAMVERIWGPFILRFTNSLIISIIIISHMPDIVPANTIMKCACNIHDCLFDCKKLRGHLTTEDAMQLASICSMWRSHTTAVWAMWQWWRVTELIYLTVHFGCRLAWPVFWWSKCSV